MFLTEVGRGVVCNFVGKMSKKKAPITATVAKRPKDTNQLAKYIMELSTREITEEPVATKPVKKKKSE